MPGGGGVQGDAVLWPWTSALCRLFNECNASLVMSTLKPCGDTIIRLLTLSAEQCPIQSLYYVCITVLHWGFL